MCLGDPVEIVQYTGERLPDAKVTGIETAGGIRDDERAFLSNQRLDAGLKSGHGALEKAFRVTLDREIVLARGGVICAANRTGTGFVVRNCDFGCNRSRGILIKASHGEVCDNVIKGSRMSAILVAPEYSWCEAGCSSDLKITGNTIRDCLGIPFASRRLPVMAI